MALYSTSRQIEPIGILAKLSIHWCTCEVNSYNVVTPYPMTKRFEFKERYIISTMVSMDMCEILRVLWESEIVLSNVYRIAIVVSTSSVVRFALFCLPRK